MHFFYKTKVYNEKITRLNFQNFVFLLAKNRRFVIIAFKMFRLQVNNINNEILNNFGLGIPVIVKKNLRKSQAQFWEKFRRLRLRQNYGFLIKKNVY